MCGIITITGKRAGEITDQKVEAMLACLAKRGPDDKGFLRFSECVLGQTRLAIVDLSPLGHQPMKDNNGPYTIVFNGEIYGYKDLRKKLENKGHVFMSHSDTEVILKAYAEYGKNCLGHLDGMFAFAIWDESIKELFVARDRFGKKPFYYTFVDGLFIAASEIKSILSTKLIKGIIDPGSLDDFLRLSYIPSHKSIYSNISMLPPAHAGIVKDGKISIWRYWELEKKELGISYESAKEKVKELFDKAVEKRMIADVEIGTLLSGGVDSTIVTLYAQKHANLPIKTFSVGYGGPKDELLFANEASKKIGTEHTTLNIKTSLSKELVKIIKYMDEPHGDSSDFPQHMISELAATKVKVALTGDGADELFMGYGWYQKHEHTPRWKPERWFGNAYKSQQKEITVFNTSDRTALLKSRPTKRDVFEKTIISNFKKPIDKVNAFDLNVYLPGQLLSKIDRTSMMHSIEMRSPFLDTDLAEFVYNLPVEFKMSRTENKIILKDILSEVFPREFVYRRKQGFGAPLVEWLSSQDTKALIERAFSKNNPVFSYINREEALRIKDGFDPRDRRSAWKLWVLTCLALWFLEHQADIA